MSLRLVTVFCGCLGIAQIVHAQPVFVTLPGGGTVPCDHPLALTAGLGCLPPLPADGCVTVHATTVCTRDDCVMTGWSPYTDDARATACALWTVRHQVPRPLTRFELHRRYRGPYPSMQIIVVGLAHAITGELVVTAQWLAASGGNRAGDVFAFKVVPGLATPWTDLDGCPECQP
jgi:hypothetical protein